MMTNKIFVTVLLILYILNVVNGYYWHRHTIEKMKTKFVFMKQELVMDAIRNVQRVDQFKEDYSMSTVYDIAQMVYFIRSKFARMVRLLILSQEDNVKFKHFHQHLPRLKEIHHLSMDIYNLIEMLEEYEAGSAKRATDMQRLKQSKLSKRIAQKLAQRLAQQAALNNMSLLMSNKALLEEERSRALREKPLDIPSPAKWGSHNRKPKGAFRDRMKIDKERDFDGAFESEFE